ncbi:MAG: hypothetical protein EZS28_041721, partial [Streblomastix strix]
IAYYLDNYYFEADYNDEGDKSC